MGKKTKELANNEVVSVETVENAVENAENQDNITEISPEIYEASHKVYSYGCRVAASIAEFHILNLKFNLYKTFGVAASDNDSAIVKILEAYTDACIKAMKQAVETEISGSNPGQTDTKEEKDEG